PPSAAPAPALHDALPIYHDAGVGAAAVGADVARVVAARGGRRQARRRSRGRTRGRTGSRGFGFGRRRLPGLRFRRPGHRRGLLARGRRHVARLGGIGIRGQRLLRGGVRERRLRDGLRRREYVHVGGQVGRVVGQGVTLGARGGGIHGRQAAIGQETVAA